MPENKTKKTKTQSSPLVGRQAKPTTLDKTTKIDIDTDKTFPDQIIIAGLSNRFESSKLEEFTTISNSRDVLYQLIDIMCQDATVSAVVRTYAEDVCELADNGHIIWCEASDPKISMYVNYLLNIMNADKNIYGWVHSLIQYGDVYLRLFRESDYEDKLFSRDSINNAYKAKQNLTESDQQAQKQESEKLEEQVRLNLHDINDHYSYYVEAVADPSTMFELTRFGKTFGYIEVPNNNLGLLNSYASANTAANGVNATVGMQYNYRMKTGDINIYQADDFVHAYLDDNFTRFPETVELFSEDLDNPNYVNTNRNTISYEVRRGKSLLYDAYKIWREKQLLESAILLSRVTKSSIIRKVGVEVGDMGKTQTQKTLRLVKEMFEQKTAYNADVAMSEYNNPGAIEQFIYYATHGGQGQITVDSVGGDYDPKQLTDYDTWNNRFYASFGIPKQYFGWTDDAAGFNGGSSLTVLSSVYAKGVKRVQNAIIQALTDIISLFLLDRGYTSYLNNFTLKMKAPLTQEEISYRENLTNRINAVNSLNSLFTDVETKSTRLQILKDLIKTLGYDDNLLTLIDNEIKAAEEAEEEERIQKEKEKKEAEKAEKEAAAAGLNTGSAGTGTSTDTSAEANAGEPEEANLEPVGEDEDMDLNLDMSNAPTAEGFSPVDGTSPLAEDIDDLFEDEDLPSPEELDKDTDFSKNN